MRMPKYKEISIPIPFQSQRVDFTKSSLEGFNSIEDAIYWQERGCGIACIKMIIDGIRKHQSLPLSPPYGILLYEGLRIGAYCERGWIHEGLVKLANRYNVSGKAYRNKNINDIIKHLERDHPCIVSVTVCFEGGKVGNNGKLKKPGGHLIVVLGFTRENETIKDFVVNHPSSHIQYNWERVNISKNLFEESFSGAFMSFEI